MERMSREDRLAQAEECLASGMTVKGWCAANGVSSNPSRYRNSKRLEFW